METPISRICYCLDRIGCLADDPTKTSSPEPCFAVEELSELPGYCRVVEITAAGRYGAVYDAQKVLRALQSDMNSLLGQDDWIRNALVSFDAERLLASMRRWLFRPQIWELLNEIEAEPVVEFVPGSSAEVSRMIM